MRRREKSSYVSDSDPPGCAQIDGLLGAEEAVRLRFIKDEQEQGDMKKRMASVLTGGVEG